MYGFEPTDEQKMLVDAVERFASNELRPAAHDAEESGELPADLIEKGWELGVLQASVPEAYGGFGDRSAVTGALAAEAMAYGDLAGALAVMAPSSYVVPILEGGTEEQKKTWLPPVIEADWKPYTAAIIEPTYNFSPGEMQTTAQADGDGYLLNGEKAFVPFADQAESMLVLADLDGSIQAFVVPAGTNGLEVAEREKMLGIHALPAYRVCFKDMHLDKTAHVGENGAGVDGAIASSQVAVAAMAVGLSKAAYEYALAYAKDRIVFGKPIAQKQAIAFMLAEMAIEIEAIRLMVWEAGWQLDQGLPEATRSAYLALTGAGDMAMMVTDRAVQILGGHGYIREHPVESWMRNGRGIPNFVGLAMV